ncbi:hypothetical protein KUTeg_003970 [Tegillarca granosa]|uniref:3-beta hydroxysteroid dehydrogenase/isomerase domain-containing protein n=1 Tax=Tegillarca granosa TaxID=220873 RepID=A0ABQ9FNM7_TEGGR|nr:hypothetical protein KUTeg_003970 [Tegillarca granosa]
MSHQRKHRKQEVHLVTGGGGYPGYNLAKKLAELGHQVILFDLREPVWPLKENMNFIQGNITDVTCLKLNILRLVYTSTYNVVFGGQEICDGDESLPYLPLNQHPDHYSRTKSIAEQKVLKVNGSKTLNGGTLYTCVLRLAGVYGPEEQRHIPRIIVRKC